MIEEHRPFYLAVAYEETEYLRVITQAGSAGERANEHYRSNGSHG
jgi:hypothetical protein